MWTISETEMNDFIDMLTDMIRKLTTNGQIHTARIVKAILNDFMDSVHYMDIGGMDK